MAQAPAAPWSRWDAPGFQFISSNTAPPPIQYDTGVGLPPSDSFIGEGGTLIGTNHFSLAGQRVNADNPEFLDCIYGAPNTAGQYVELCYRDNGCCQTGCCENVSWQEKYRWALALIIVFCIFVVVVVVVSIFCWLFNRAKDKRQKKLLLGSTQGLSPAASQASIAALPAGQNAAGYYPYVGGPKQPY